MKVSSFAMKEVILWPRSTFRTVKHHPNSCTSISRIESACSATSAALRKLYELTG
jgi:hypothetical protein